MNFKKLGFWLGKDLTIFGI